MTAKQSGFSKRFDSQWERRLGTQEREINSQADNNKSFSYNFKKWLLSSLPVNYPFSHSWGCLQKMQFNQA